MGSLRRDDRDRNVRPISLTRRDTASITGVTAADLEGAGQAGFPVELALAEYQGPWRRDRVTLSLEAQSILMEMRAAARSLLDFAGQIYANVVSQLRVAAGRLLKLEPFGGYRLVWKN